MLKMIEEDADPALLAERMDATDSSKLLTNIQPKPLPQSTAAAAAAASHTTTTTTSAADQASTSAYRDGVTFAQCKECGCHGPLADFLEWLTDGLFRSPSKSFSCRFINNSRILDICLEFCRKITASN